MKKKIFAIITIAMLLLFILFFIFKDEREKELTDKGDQIIEKIEAFRQEHHKIPKTLSEVGFTNDDGANMLFYDVYNDTTFTLSFIMSMDYNKTYYSDVKQWEYGYRELKLK